MKIVVVLAALLLGACNAAAHVDNIPQRVWCLQPGQYDKLSKAEPAKVGQTLTGDARKDVKIEGEQNVLLRRYADGLLNVLEGCVGTE